VGPSGQRRRTTGERLGRRLAVRHGMSDGVKTVRVLPGTGAMPARGACEPQGRVKVDRRRKGSWGTCERVEDIRCDAPVVGVP
jgi:hypothetical protein